MHVLAIILFKY